MPTNSESPKTQFTIRHLFVATTLIAFALVVVSTPVLLVPAICLGFVLGPALAVVLFWDYFRMDPTKTIVSTVASLIIALAILLLAR